MEFYDMECSTGPRDYDIPPGIPARTRRAMLVTGNGRHLGRFALSRTRDSRWHCWEWLSGGWPDERFFMVPDDFEAEVVPALARCYALPAEIRRPGPEHAAGITSGQGALFNVWRIDGDHRHLAVLRVSAGHLSWWEARESGVLELAPAWLMFEPRIHPVKSTEVDRCLIQADRAHSRRLRQSLGAAHRTPPEGEVHRGPEHDPPTSRAIEWNTRS